MIALLLAALLAAETQSVRELDAVISEDDGTLEVIRVTAGGRGERAGLKPGLYILRVGGTEVGSLSALRDALADQADGPLDLEVSDVKRARDSALMIGLSASGHAFTGEEDIKSAWLGFLVALELTEHVRALAGFGYTAIGTAPFKGRDAWTPLLGAQLEGAAFFDALTPFGRILIGPNITWHEGRFLSVLGFSSNPVHQETLSVIAQAGVRVWWLEASLSAGWGPAKDQNIGMNLTLWFPLGSLFE